MDGKKPLFSADEAEEYFSTLLTYYRNTANDIFKRDNEGRHSSNQIYSAEYQKYLGMQIAIREVLEYFAKFELGDTAIRQQETVTNRNGLNEPLTNAQRIRDMSDEEMAEWVTSGGNCAMTICDHICGGKCNAIKTFKKSSEEACKEIVMKWLQQPAEEDDHE